MLDRPTPGTSLKRLLLAPVAVAAAFGPIAWSRSVEPVLWAHEPEGMGAFWGTIAAVALAGATLGAGTGREAVAILLGFGAGTSVGWLIGVIPCLGSPGLLAGPVVGVIAFRLARIPGDVGSGGGPTGPVGPPRADRP